jgi:nucleotide-binding universal stress UspA family protein
VARSILIATDGSPLASRAVEQGVALAKATGASVVIVHVVQALHTLGGREDMFAGQPEAVRKAAVDFLFAESRQICDCAVKVAVEAGVPVRSIQASDDHPYSAILRIAREEGCDLIAVATHGRRGLSALLLGSETSKLLAHADRPVLVCR